MLDEWVRVWRTDCSPRTRQDCATISTRYIPTALRARRLTELTPAMLQAWINGLRASGLAPRTVRMRLGVVRAALNKAVKLGKLRYNVARDCDLPKQDRREMRSLDPAQAQRFLAAAKGDRYEALFALLLTAGLRPGEVRALRWADVTDGVVRVTRAVSSAKGPAEIGPTKTGRNRAIPLTTVTREALKAHRARQAAERLRAGGEYRDADLIFATEAGGPVEHNNLVNRHYRKILQRAGLPALRLYDLRHTCATLLLTQGTHAKVVQERLGHSTVALTLDVYSHVSPTMQAEATAAMERVLGG